MLLAVPKNNPVVEKAKAVDGLPYPWLDIRETAQCNYIIQDRTCRMREDVNRLLELEQFTPRIRLIAHSTYSALECVSSGIGLCIISDDYLALRSYENDLCVFCVGTPPVRSTFGVIYRKGWVFPPIVQEFLQLCKQYSRNW